MTDVIPSQNQLARHRAILVLLDQRFNKRISPRTRSSINEAVGGYLFTTTTTTSSRRNRVSVYAVGNAQSSPRYGASWKSGPFFLHVSPLPHIHEDGSWYLIEYALRGTSIDWGVFSYVYHDITEMFSEIKLWPGLCRNDAPVWTLQGYTWVPHKNLPSV